MLGSSLFFMPVGKCFILGDPTGARPGMLTLCAAAEPGSRGSGACRATTAFGSWNIGVLSVVVALVSEMQACAYFPRN